MQPAGGLIEVLSKLVSCTGAMMTLLLLLPCTKLLLCLFTAAAGAAVCPD
jgi:hypothetical protein